MNKLVTPGFQPEIGRMKTTPAEALVLGSGITALGVLRCLAQVGVPALVALDRPFVHRRSRWYRAAGAGGDTLSACLQALPTDRAVLFPCTDHWAREVAALPSDLRERFPSAAPPLKTLDRFLDKGLFWELLEDTGVPHPGTILVDDAFDSRELPFGDRVFIKPRNSQAFQLRFDVKAFSPQSLEDMVEMVGMARGAGLEVVLQEYIPGPPSNHYFVDGFVDAGGAIRATFVRRRLRMHPPLFGNSSHMVSVPREEGAQAVDDVGRLLGGAGYRGIFSAEFKKDERDGLFKILEVNARPWWFVEFAANCGVNVVLMAYRDALGLPVEDVREYRVGKRFVHPYFDLHACLRESSSGVEGLLKFFRALPGADQPVFRWNDPWPAITEGWALGASFVRRRLPGGSGP